MLLKQGHKMKMLMHSFLVIICYPIAEACVCVCQLSQVSLAYTASLKGQKHINRLAVIIITRYLPLPHPTLDHALAATPILKKSIQTICEMWSPHTVMRWKAMTVCLCNTLPCQSALWSPSSVEGLLIRRTPPCCGPLGQESNNSV